MRELRTNTLILAYANMILEYNNNAKTMTPTGSKVVTHK